MLKDPDANVRKSAAEALSNFPAYSNQTIMPLIRLVHDESDEVRRAAIGALGLIGRRSDPAVEALNMALSDPDPSTAGKAALALYRLSNRDENIVPSLIIALSHEQDATPAISALAKMIISFPAVTEKMLGALHGNNPFLQGNVIRVFGLAGNKGTRVLPELVKMYDSVAPSNRAILARTILNQDTLGNYSALIIGKTLKEDDATVRREGINSLVRLTNHRDFFLPFLSTALADEDDQNKIIAIKTASSYASDQEKIRDRIIELTRSDNPKVRTVALAAVGFFPLISKSAIDILEEAAKNEDEHIRMAAFMSLHNIGKRDPESSLPILEKAFARETDYRTKEYIASALYDFGIVKPLTPAPPGERKVIPAGWELGRND